MRNLGIFFVVIIVLLLASYAGYNYFLKDNKETDTEQTDTNDDSEEVITSTEDVKNLINTNPNTKIFKNRADDSNIFDELENKEVDIYTVLIPTDVAFSEINEELGDLSNSEKINLLKTHIILDNLSPERILELNNKEVETFAGTKLKISITNGVVSFEDENGNTAKISEPNLQVSGGYAYLIDNVLGR